ncbi:multiple monosaccharide ABC transporter permease [Cellulomonas edaphi]|uniref:Xylose transport system permease protein XylH n=1 Tax=Cellulomonas edaphi TaxID=3053468 RepID=A0ABT7SA79_9CELL|nr:multiple monosaccharide ABC transporter permease [Cellulomons edaphi]MDM7832476.1 sugar ABC transporter permease [Cellulomons edaphi]
MKEAFKQLLGGGIRQFGMVIALVALLVFFQWRTDGKVLTPTNAQNIINGNSYILILAVGMVLVIIAGHIDLSVGSVAAVTGIVVALAIRDWGISWWVGVLLGLGVGLVIGMWQGMWVAYVGIPGFITTLAGMLIFRGAQQVIGKSNSVPVPEGIQKMGSGYLPEWGPNTGLNNSTLLLGILAIAFIIWSALRQVAKIRRNNLQDVAPMAVILRAVILSAVVAYLTYLFGSGRSGTSFPISGCILLVLVIVYSFVANRTIIGRHVYAVGGNRSAAALSGVNIKRVNFFVMANMAVLAALAGIVFTGRSTSSGPSDGVGWELDAIAAVFIGGAAVSGGVGTVVGSVIGGLVMAVLNNGLALLGVGSGQTQIIKGLVLLAAVAFDVYNKVQGRPSIFGLIFKGKNKRAEELVSESNEESASVAVADGETAARG